jgi:peptide/nickel transport system permease protein
MKQLRRNKPAVAGLVCIVLLVAGAIFAGVLPISDPDEQTWTERLTPPSSTHLLGTDEFGRDMLARVLYGGRISLAAGVVPVLLGGTIGTALGLVAGFLGGRWDHLLMRLMDVLLAFPTLFLALAIVGTLGSGLLNAMLAVAVISIPGYARLVRGQVLTVREREFVTAARASGAGTGRILAKHLLPNVMAPLLVQSTLNVGYAILATASLSFLGLGTQPPTADWGMMLATARQYLPEAWWLAVFPGAMIMLSVLSVNLLGEGLRDAVGR